MVDFNLIKGRIEKHRLSSLVHNILSSLKAVDKNKRYPFWNLLSLLKWSYLYTTDFIARKKIQPHEFDTLLKLTQDFETQYLIAGFKSSAGVKRSFKILAFQQFSHQETFYKSVIDRQIVFYNVLTSSYDIPSEFKRLTGIDLKDFFGYCQLLYIYFNASDFDKRFNYDGILKADFFKLFEEHFSKADLNSFLNVVSLKSKDDFENLHKLSKELLQLFETNFYVTKPVLLFKGEYHLIHRGVLVQFMKHFVYTFLKQKSDSFSNEFGLRLERYIELGLKEIGIDYKTEGKLKKKYHLEKVVDYLVEPDILIESKGIELHPRSGVLREPDILSKDLNKNIVKAYCQLLSTAAVIDKNKIWYGIIVTYKEMYLGFGNDAWAEFLKEPVEIFAHKNSIDIDIMPPENIFFIDIEYWDYLVQSIKDGKGSLKEILNKAKEMNMSNNPIEQVFLISQVLTKHFTVERLDLSYLNVENYFML